MKVSSVAKYLGSRLVQLIVVVAVVTFLTSVIFALVPGKPENIYVPIRSDLKCDPKVDPKSDDCIALKVASTRRAEVRQQLNLNDGLVVRWGKWFGNFLQGDFGNRYTSSGPQPVKDKLMPSLRVSLLLMLYAQLLALAVAIPLGVWAAYREGGLVDRIISSAAFAALSLPGFAVALILSYYLGVKFAILPPLGYKPPTQNFLDHLRRMIIPAISLALGPIAVYLRLLRGDMTTTLRQDFIQMARAKGLSPRRILWRHALRPSSLTLLTVAGLNIGTMIGSAIVVEYLFAIPGMGQQVGQSIFGRQYVALQSYVAVLAIIFVLVNFIVDALYKILDPRISS